MSGPDHPVTVVVVSTAPTSPDERRILASALTIGSQMIDPSCRCGRRSLLPRWAGPARGEWSIGRGGVSSVSYVRNGRETITIAMDHGSSLVVSQPSSRTFRPLISMEAMIVERLRLASHAIGSSSQIVIGPRDVDDWTASTDAGAYLAAVAGDRPASYLLRSPYGDAAYAVDGRYADEAATAVFDGTHGETVLIAAVVKDVALEIMITPVAGMVRRMPVKDPVAVLRHMSDMAIICR